MKIFLHENYVDENKANYGRFHTYTDTLLYSRDLLLLNAVTLHYQNWLKWSSGNHLLDSLLEHRRSLCGSAPGSWVNGVQNILHDHARPLYQCYIGTGLRSWLRLLRYVRHSHCSLLIRSINSMHECLVLIFIVHAS